MRKIYSLVLIAAGLLIGTQGWAQTNTCKIGITEYESVAAAIAAVPANDVPTTIEMIADEDVGNTGECYATIQILQNVILDLKGKKLSGYSDKATGSCFFRVKGGDKDHAGQFGTLTIQDSDAPNDPTLGTGIISWKQTVGQNNTAHNVITNSGKLLVKSGVLKLETDLSIAYTADYVIDNYAYGVYNNIETTIENGYIYSTVECFRNYPVSQTYTCNLNLLGGVYHGDYGLIFVQAENGGKQNISISNGDYTSDKKPLIRVYTDNNSDLGLTNIDVTGDDTKANVSILEIDHNVYFTGNISDDTKTLEGLIREFEKDYASVFNFTGGTFANDKYKITSNIIENAQGGYSVVETPSMQDYTLPTLLDGALYRDSLHSIQNPDGTITIVPLWKLNLNPQDGAYTDLREPTSGLTVRDENVEFKGVDSVYSLVVDAVDAIVKNGAILNVGPGGVQAKNGGRIIVEAGGILKVGEYGFEGADANSLVVYSSPTASGVVAISPMAYLHNTPALKIVMNSNAYTNPDNHDDYYWQFFAIPTNGNCHFQWSEGAAPYMKRYDVGTQTWINITNPNDLNTPFVGYAMTNDCPARGNGQYTMTGNLVGRENAVMKLTVPTNGSETGWNLLGNSYLAPIDVNELIADIKVGDDVISRSVYAYNSYNGQYVISSKTVKGTIVTPGGNKSFTSIAPMSAFFLENTSNAEAAFTINYAKTVYGKENIEPMMAPARSNDAKVLNIHVQAGKYADDLYFVQNGDEDDNITKLMNDNMNIYAVVGDKKQISVNTNDMSNMPIAFQASNDVEYTITISNNNCDDYVLVDNLTNAQVAMTDGATYTFVATPNETTENRFEIRKAAGVVSNLAEMKAAHAVKGIYTAAGQYVGKADRWNTLPAGMYIVDGVRMAK